MEKKDIGITEEQQKWLDTLVEKMKITPEQLYSKYEIVFKDNEPKGRIFLNDVEVKEEETSAYKLLADPASLYKIGQKLERNGYVGDLETKLAVYLAGTTKDYKRDDRISIILKAQSGAGKSTILNLVERYFEDVISYHRITAHAPDYLGEEIGTLDGKILIIKQMEGSADSQYTVMIMVDPVSGGLKLLTVENQKTKTLELKGIPVMFTTTVDIDLDPQTLRRFYTTYADDSAEQTRKVMAHKAKMESDPSYRNMIKSTDEDLLQIPKLLKEKSAKFGVIIPFAEEIAKKFPKVLLARTDIGRFFAFIRAITHLHCRQRFLFRDIEGEMNYIASPVDFHYAWEITKVSIPKRLGGITDERSYKIFTIVCKKCQLDDNVDISDVMKIAYTEGMNYSQNTIWHTLNDLRDKGYIKSERNPTDKRRLLWSLTEKSYEPFGITFPDENIENIYLQEISDHCGPKIIRKSWDHLRRSLEAVDIRTGKKVDILSKSTKTLLKI